jgi:hypothetical protein
MIDKMKKLVHRAGHANISGAVRIGLPKASCFFGVFVPTVLGTRLCFLAASQETEKKRKEGRKVLAKPSDD